jgi:hypothetical protein
MVLFLPIVLGIAAVTDLGSEVIAALLGTFAGYVFSPSQEQSAKQEQSPKEVRPTGDDR